MMFCRVRDLKNKCVVNVRNGSKLGYVSDVEIDTASATVTAITVKGGLRLFGILGREPDEVIGWSDIEVIGEDAILVNNPLPPLEQNGRAGKTGGFFRILMEDD